MTRGLVQLDGHAAVYFLQPEQGGPIKIGYTRRNLQHRLGALMAANAFPLVVLGVIPTKMARALEGQLHLRFASHRDHAEWFYPVPTLLRYIDEYATALDDIEPLPTPDEATTSPFLEPMLKLDEAARIARLSPTTLRRCARAGTITCYRIGRQLRFMRSELETELHEGQARRSALALTATTD